MNDLTAAGAGYQALARPAKDSLSQDIHDGIGWKIGLYGMFGGLLIASLAPKLRGPALALAGAGTGVAVTSMVQKRK